MTAADKAIHRAAKAAFGYAKAGMELGVPHNLYRPTSATVPALAAGNLLRAIPFASTSTPDNSFRRPSKFSEDVRYGLFDVRLATDAITTGDDLELILGASDSTVTPSTPVRPGDYIDGPSGTLFVASVEPFEPIMLVQCNAVISGARSAGIQPGLNTTYGGRTTATDAVEFIDWPASIRQGGNSEAGRAALPGDPRRFGGALCKLPTIPGVTFRAGDRIVVKNGDTWMISGAILQSQGWELTLSSAEA